MAKKVKAPEKKYNLTGTGEVLEPKLEDYLKESKGQGLGSLVTADQDVITHQNETRVL